MLTEPLTWTQLSKVVGFKRVKDYEYPTIGQIHQIDRRSKEGDMSAEEAAHTLLSWYRFLPSPIGPEQKHAIDMLVEIIARIRSEKS